MKKNLVKFWQKPVNEKTIIDNSTIDKISHIDLAMNNLVKMSEATKLLKASAPTVRKYARLGCYKEYRFGEKLVFYDKEEILNFIINRQI